MLRVTGRTRLGVLAAALAFLLAPSLALAASCCGGAAGPSIIVPKLFRSRLDVSFDWEKYDGFWDSDGTHRPDPPGTDLNQYRLNVAYARRFGERWQAYVGVPYVWNDNDYSGTSSDSNGLGDSLLGVWWGASSGWLYLGPSLTVPTGVSPYDDVDNSFDVTGRGFYRLDANALIEKTVSDWDFFLLLSYGWYFERPVNREFGRDVDPYDKDLGDRFSGTAAVSYTLVTQIGRWTGTGGFNYVHEEEGTIDGHRDPTGGLQKSALTGTATYSTLDRVWMVRASWSHAIQEDDWGENFPTTDTYTLGVSYAFR